MALLGKINSFKLFVLDLFGTSWDGILDNDCGMLSSCQWRDPIRIQRSHLQFNSGSKEYPGKSFCCSQEHLQFQCHVVTPWNRLSYCCCYLRRNINGAFPFNPITLPYFPSCKPAFPSALPCSIPCQISVQEQEIHPSKMHFIIFICSQILGHCSLPSLIFPGDKWILMLFSSSWELLGMLQVFYTCNGK